MFILEMFVGAVAVYALCFFVGIPLGLIAMGLNDRDKNLICAGLWLLLGVPNFVEVDPLNTGHPISDWAYFVGL